MLTLFMHIACVSVCVWGGGSGLWRGVWLVHLLGSLVTRDHVTDVCTCLPLQLLSRCKRLLKVGRVLRVSDACAWTRSSQTTRILPRCDVTRRHRNRYDRWSTCPTRTRHSGHVNPD